jgi:hypothetical protein
LHAAEHGVLITDVALQEVATPIVEPVVEQKPRRRGRFGVFVLGFLVGVLALFGLALFASLKNL